MWHNEMMNDLIQRRKCAFKSQSKFKDLRVDCRRNRIRVAIINEWICKFHIKKVTLLFTHWDSWYCSPLLLLYLLFRCFVFRCCFLLASRDHFGKEELTASLYCAKILKGENERMRIKILFLASTCSIPASSRTQKICGVWFFFDMRKRTKEEIRRKKFIHKKVYAVLSHFISQLMLMLNPR